jgi:hypothetical protein
MIELRCPSCEAAHWELDHDFRGISGSELGYAQRTYGCPRCGHRGSGYSVLLASPPEFFLQPHDLYPMSIPDFVYWLRLFNAHFPDDPRLTGLGISWYPGPRQPEHDSSLSQVRDVGCYSRYHVSLSSWGVDEARIRVCVQGEGEAYFWVGSSIDLDRCYYGFDDKQLDRIRDLLRTHRKEIVAAWERYRVYAKPSRARWLAALGEVGAA